MAFEKYLADKAAVVFGFDDVIYPVKDYLLQVYYLFSEFMAYSEQVDASEVLNFMQTAYLSTGTTDIFEKTAKKFNLPLKYHDNFLNLHKTARLPLKLLLYRQVLAFMQEIVTTGRQVFILIEGDVAQQVNKIKQLEWNGLETNMKVYFTAETVNASVLNAFNDMLMSNNLVEEDVLLVTGHQTLIALSSKNINRLQITELI